MDDAGGIVPAKRLRIVRHRGERGRVGGGLLEPIVPRRAQRRVGLDERRLLARVLRRGSFADKATAVRSSARFRYDHYANGFRVARDFD